ncbi:hypothetical protein Asera_42840 [Actinocatenispora sera]|uniref:Glycosyltransferase RgtA/B/C/D-like domain-containing protein n=1 Tax=Actinocatenispora sera TaxID=390989 RepID=A0A810L751_9ACTN|nr:hypothetical protein Asera_42840 [Actinocatenispora sera]
MLLPGTAALYLVNLSANGHANSFYAGAGQADTISWKALLCGAVDAGSGITVDKPPASIWLMALSGRVFGFSSWSMPVPQALLGVASVALLYGAVRPVAGYAAGLGAGAILALTPVAVLTFRFDDPDALLVLLMVAGACAVTGALVRRAGRAVAGRLPAVHRRVDRQQSAATGPRVQRAEPAHRWLRRWPGRRWHARRGEGGIHRRRQRDAGAGGVHRRWRPGRRWHRDVRRCDRAELELAVDSASVLGIGGLSGSDAHPTVAQFRRYVAAGEVRYYVAGGMGGGRGGPGGTSSIDSWVAAHSTEKTVGGGTIHGLSKPAD